MTAMQRHGLFGMSREQTRFIVLIRRKDGRPVAVGDTGVLLGESAEGRIRVLSVRRDAFGAAIELRADRQLDAEAYANALPGVRAGEEEASVVAMRDGYARRMGDARPVAEPPTRAAQATVSSDAK